MEKKTVKYGTVTSPTPGRWFTAVCEENPTCVRRYTTQIQYRIRCCIMVSGLQWDTICKQSNTSRLRSYAMKNPDSRNHSLGEIRNIWDFFEVYTQSIVIELWIIVINTKMRFNNLQCAQCLSPNKITVLKPTNDVVNGRKLCKVLSLQTNVITSFSLVSLEKL